MVDVAFGAFGFLHSERWEGVEGLLGCLGFGNRAEIRALSGFSRVLQIVGEETPRL